MWRLATAMVLLLGCGGAPGATTPVTTTPAPTVDLASSPRPDSDSATSPPTIDAGSDAATPECASYIAIPGVAGCQFYTCLEAQHPCGPDGYYLEFGDKYCVRFLTDVWPKMSPAGQAFLTTGRDCLMHAVLAIDTESCADVRTDALASHVACYRDNGFCALPLSDKLTLFFAVDSADRDFASMLETELACF
jgi:hypothetical protein